MSSLSQSNLNATYLLQDVGSDVGQWDRVLGVSQVIQHLLDEDASFGDILVYVESLTVRRLEQDHGDC